MSEKNSKSLNHVLWMINDASQRSAATWFRCGGTGTFDHYIIQIYWWVCFELLFKIVQHLAKVWGKLIASSALSPEALSCWKMKNSLEVWRMTGRNCYNSIMLRLNSRIMSFWSTCIKRVYCRPLVTRRLMPSLQAFCRVIFLLGWWMCVQPVILWVFWCGQCKHVFVCEQSNANIIGRIFWATVLNGWALHGSSLHLDLRHSDLLSKAFHKVV